MSMCVCVCVVMLLGHALLLYCCCHVMIFLSPLVNLYKMFTITASMGGYDKVLHHFLYYYNH